MLKYLQNRGYVYTLGIVLGLSVASFLFAFDAKAILYSNGVDQNNGFLATSTGETVTGIHFLNMCSEYNTGADFWVNIQANGLVWATSTVYNTTNDLEYKLISECDIATSSYPFTFYIEPYTLVNGVEYQFVVYTDGTDTVMFGESTDTSYPYLTQINCTRSGCSTPGYPYKAKTSIGSYGLLSGNTKLEWFFPQEDQIYNNSEWNDYALQYKIMESEIGSAYNYILIVSQDADGNSFTEFDIIATTTELTNWTINRSNDFKDGEVWSHAGLFKVDYGETPVEIAETEPIRWYASSTSEWTIFDNPWLVTGSFPATTTTSSANLEDLNTILGLLYRIFPFGLLLQINTIFNDLEENASENTNEAIYLSDLLPEEIVTLIPSTESALIYNNTMVSSKIAVWDTHIYPAMEGIIYIFGLITIMGMLIPSIKGITLPNLHKSEKIYNPPVGVPAQINRFR